MDAKAKPVSQKESDVAAEEPIENEEEDSGVKLNKESLKDLVDEDEDEDEDVRWSLFFMAPASKDLGHIVLLLSVFLSVCLLKLNVKT